MAIHHSPFIKLKEKINSLDRGQYSILACLNIFIEIPQSVKDIYEEKIMGKM